MKLWANAYDQDYDYPVQMIVIKNGRRYHSGHLHRSSALAELRRCVETRHSSTILSGQDCSLLIATPYATALVHRAQGMSNREIARSLSRAAH